MDLRSQTLDGLKWTTLSTIVTMIAKLTQVIVLARLLTKEDFGVVAIALLFIAFTDIFLEMGLSTAVIHKQNISISQISSLFWVNIISGIIIFIILLIITPVISDFYNIDELNKIIPLLSLTILFSSVSRLQKTLQQKLFQFKFISIVEISAAILMTIIAIVLAFDNWGVYSLIYSTIFNALFIACIYIILALKNRNILFHFSIKETKPFFQIGVYQLQSSILDFFSKEIDSIIISKSYSLEILGAYTLCKQLILRTYSIINPTLTKVITPILASIQDNRSLIKSKYIQLIEYASFINYPIYFMIGSLAVPILTIFYGYQYSEYNITLAILAINYALLSIGNPVGSLQVALGRTDLGFYWTIFRVISIIVFLSLGSLFDFNIFISFMLFSNIFNIYPSIKIMISKMINLSFKEYVKVQLKPIVISSIMFIVIYNLDFNITDLFNLIIKGIIFMLGYTILSYLFNKKIVISTVSLLNRSHTNKSF